MVVCVFLNMRGTAIMKRVGNMNCVSARSRFANIIIGMLFLVGPTIGHAAPILIDFADAAAAPSFGGTWNTIPAPSGTTQLVDATGATTSITLSFSDHWIDDLIPLTPWPHGNIAWIDANAAKDQFFYNLFDFPGVGSINIAGLATNLFYRIDLLAAEDFSSLPSTGTADFSIFGSFGDSVPNGDNFDVFTDGLVGGNFMTWNAVAPNPSSEIVIQVVGSDTSSPHMLGANVNAARITCLQPSAAGVPQEVNCPSAVPEPVSLALFGLGLAGLAFSKRRKA
jgi:hypothetical protein